MRQSAAGPVILLISDGRPVPVPEGFQDGINVSVRKPFFLFHLADKGLGARIMDTNNSAGVVLIVIPGLAGVTNHHFPDVDQENIFIEPETISFFFGGHDKPLFWPTVSIRHSGRRRVLVIF